AGCAGDQPVTVGALEHERLARPVGRSAAAEADIDFGRFAAVAHCLFLPVGHPAGSRAEAEIRQSANPLAVRATMTKKGQGRAGQEMSGIPPPEVPHPMMKALSLLPSGSRK